MKLLKLLLLVFFFLPVLKSGAQENSFKQLEKELLDRGYTFAEKVFPHNLYEIECYRKRFGKKHIEISIDATINKGAIEYYFLFLSKDKVNDVVSAFIYDEEGKERHYYKINTTNEPANTWVYADMNGDGVIEKDEGHIAWW